ncbi:hypothetical protein CUMW_196080 [Citrus unshiu]|nr:hypothetical protein CUMW_196080 [Citrus unshiu]
MGSDSEAERTPHKDEKKKIVSLAPIAKPLAGKKLSKRTLKLVRRAAEHKCLKRGVKEVVKSIRRGHKGSLGTLVQLMSSLTFLSYVKSLIFPTFMLLQKRCHKEANMLCFGAKLKPTKGELGQEEQDKIEADYTRVEDSQTAKYLIFVQISGNIVVIATFTDDYFQ